MLTGGSPVLQVHPSRRCNLACGHCYSLSGPHQAGELPPGLLSGVLEDAARLGYLQLAVSGGEPLLYRGLPELLRQAKALGMLTTLTTNGMLASGARWEVVAPFLDAAAISIDGIEADHDQIRGQAGAFRRTVENLESVRSSGVPFGFIFTLTQFNADSLRPVVELAAQTGARSVQVHPLSLQGRALEKMPAAQPDQVELLAALAEARMLNGKEGVRVHVDAITLRQVRAFREQLVPAQPFLVTGLAPVLMVGADGSILPLAHDIDRRFHLGQIHQAPLAVLASDWLDSRAAEVLAQVCGQTWNELASQSDRHAFYWYDEVAARSRIFPPCFPAPLPLGKDLRCPAELR